MCRFHNNDHIKGSVLALSMDMAKGLYSLAALGRWGVNFMRVVNSVPFVGARRLLVIRAEPPAECATFGAELLDYATLHHDCREKKHGSDSPDPDPMLAKEKYRAEGQQLLAVLNGPVWKPGAWVHYCPHTGCCDCWDPKVTLKKIIKHMVGVCWAKTC